MTDTVSVMVTVRKQIAVFHANMGSWMLLQAWHVEHGKWHFSGIAVLLRLQPQAGTEQQIDIITDAMLDKQ